MSYAYSPRDNSILRLSDSGEIREKIVSLQSACENLKKLTRELYKNKESMEMLSKTNLLLRQDNMELKKYIEQLEKKIGK